jgi:hypothetical protein
MRIVELIIDEKDDTSGIEAVSVVESPAIESDFIALKKHEIELKEVDAEKRILMGAALIPNKQIYRTNDKKEEYYIYFSEATVRKASELFFMNSNQNNATLEHNEKLKGMSVVESWIIEGEYDKSMNYGFNLPKGTWMISMKVNNDEIWNKVKLGEIKGFSIEGYFADKYEMSLKNIDMEEKAMVEKIKDIITKSELAKHEVALATVKEIDAKLKSLGLPFSEISKAQTNVKSAQNSLRILEKTINEDLQEARIIEQKAKELGIDAGLANSIKYAQDKLKQAVIANSLFARFVAEIEKFK